METRHANAGSSEEEDVNGDRSNLSVDCSEVLCHRLASGVDSDLAVSDGDTDNADIELACSRDFSAIHRKRV